MTRRVVHRIVVFISTALIATLLPSTAIARDLSIWDRLAGTNPQGYVLLMRHSLAPGIGDPANFRLGDCSTQRNLSDEGRLDAQDIGQWLKNRDVPILRVESSRWCRARETAELLDIGTVRANRNLDSLFQDSDPLNNPQTAKIRNRIIGHQKSKGLLVFVGHSVNISALTGVSLESGEGVLVRADSRGKIRVVGFSPAP